MTRWVSPTSSKNRSNTTVLSVGSVPSASLPAAKYWASWFDASGARPSSPSSHCSQSAGAPSSFSIACSRRRETETDSSSLRAGASPNQNGIVGGWPRASSTNTLFTSTRSEEHTSELQSQSNLV